MSGGRVLVPVLVSILALFCGPARPPAAGAPGVQGPDAGVDPAAREVLDVMDPTADPCSDFYRYACGGWLDRATIPPDETRWGRGAEALEARNAEILRSILEDAEASPGDDPGRRRLGSFYRACMDEAGIESAGLDPILPLLQRIARVQEPITFMKIVGQFHGIGVPALFRVTTGADPEDPSRVLAYFEQGGLGLPDRDAYLRDDDATRELREAYRRHVARMFEISGLPASLAGENADEVLRFEAALAGTHLPLAEMPSPVARYERLDLDALRGLEGRLAWDTYLQAAELRGVVAVGLATPDAFRRMAGVLSETRQRTLEAYLRWQLLHGVADLLGREFVEENFAFYGGRLAGRKELPARWKRCVRAADAFLGASLGRLYVVRTGTRADTRAMVDDLVEDVRHALADEISRLDWMDGETKERAAEKLAAMANHVGFPDRWRDESALRIESDTHLVNVLEARNYEFKRRAAQVGGARDASEWIVTAPSVRVRYEPTTNRLFVPDGILEHEPPGGPAAANFGGLGTIVARELTAGFDDRGRWFDGGGRPTDWWSPDTAAKFEERAACARRLGVDVAELGGVRIAHRAWRVNETRGGSGRNRAGLEGLSEEQLFFVRFAQARCDPSDSARAEVHAPLANFPEFARAFRCDLGSPMHPSEVCAVW
jgi:predicted metalloendopeptidase